MPGVEEQRPIPPSRRAVLRAGLGLAASAALAGCGQLDLTGGGLRFWNGFTGPDGRTMLGIVRGFNDAHPDAGVTMQRLDWATYYSKLFVAGLSERSPEVFVLHREQVPRFAGAGLVRPLDDLVAADGRGAIAVPPGDFDANVWAATSFDGTRYAVPLDIHPSGMFYNKDIFDRAGVAEPPTDRAGFLAALRAIKRLDAGLWGIVFADQRIVAYTAMRQFGGSLVSDDGRTSLIDSPQNAEAWQFLVDLIAEGLAPLPSDYGAWAGFKQGRVGVVLHGIYMIGDLKKQSDLRWAAAPTPTFGTQPGVWASSHCLCLRPDLEGETLAASAAFVAYLSDHSLTWADAGQVPVRKSLRQTPAFAAMAAQSAFARQIPIAQYPPGVRYLDEMMTAFDFALDKTLRREQTPAEGLARLGREVQGIIDRYAREGGLS